MPIPPGPTGPEDIANAMGNDDEFVDHQYIGIFSHPDNEQASITLTWDGSQIMGDDRPMREQTVKGMMIGLEESLSNLKRYYDKQFKGPQGPHGLGGKIDFYA